MSAAAVTHWRLALGLLAVAGYLLLSHLAMTHAPQAPGSVVLILGPLLLAAFGWAWRQRQAAAVMAAVIAAVLPAGVVMSGHAVEVNHLYVLQHAGIHAALGLSFFASLRSPSGLTVIGLLAARLHRMTPDMVTYTRQVTGVWTLYFFVMATTSVLIFWLRPWSAWSAFANLVTPLSAVVLFVAEHRLRYVLHPEFERVSLLDGLRAWQRPVRTRQADGR